MILATVLVVAALSGCGMAPGSGSKEDSRTSESTNEPAETTKSSGAPPGHRDSPRPPESTLSYGGETVVGALGTYCWSSASVGQCVDTIGIGARRDGLTVPKGSTVTFVYGGRELDSVGAAAYRIGPEDQPKEIGKNIVLTPSGNGIELPVHRAGNRARVTVELPAGRYVLDVFVTVPQGDASYGFLVAVQ